MTVYVDNARIPYGRMVMCHMIASTTEELFEMADRLRIARKWVQFHGQQKEHFDISAGRRSMAVKMGAKEVTSRELVTRQLTHWQLNNARRARSLDI